MPEKIEVISYARETPFLRQSIKKFIGKYQRHKPNLVLSFVNPDTAPDEARNLGITVNGEIAYEDKDLVVLNSSQNKSWDIDIEQTQRFDVEGKIGEKLSLKAQQDSEADFSWERR